MKATDEAFDVDNRPDGKIHGGLGNVDAKAQGWPPLCASLRSSGGPQNSKRSGGQSSMLSPILHSHRIKRDGQKAIPSDAGPSSKCFDDDSALKTVGYLSRMTSWNGSLRLWRFEFQSFEQNASLAGLR